MNAGFILDSLNHSINLVKEFKLYKSKGIKYLCKDGVSDAFKKASLSSEYSKIFQTAIQNLDYDLLLTDDSFFQFEVDLNGARFAFFQNPHEHISFSDFISKTFGEYNEEYDEYFNIEYEQFLNEQNLNSGALTIRYDLDFSNYNPNIHSASHFHIGHKNNLRIPCDKIITPLSFVIFVIKNIYYYEWKEAIEKGNEHLDTQLNELKQACSQIDARLWTDVEKREFFIT